MGVDENEIVRKWISEVRITQRKSERRSKRAGNSMIHVANAVAFRFFPFEYLLVRAWGMLLPFSLEYLDLIQN